MQVIAMSCDHCGAPFSVPDGARSAICVYCGARLEVDHFGTDADRAGLDREQRNGDGGAVIQKPVGDRRGITADRSDTPVSWQVVASFKFVHDWHEAAHVLGRVGIMARMLDDPQDASYSALAVLAPNAETARQLLTQPGRSASPGG